MIDIIYVLFHASNPEHRCELCNITYNSMSEYRSHLTGTWHKKNLKFLRGEDNDKPVENNKYDLPAYYMLVCMCVLLCVVVLMF